MYDELVADFLKANRLLPPEAFNKVMGWEESTRAAYLSRGEGPVAIRVGRSLFYKYDDVGEYIETHGVTPKQHKRKNSVDSALLSGGVKK